MHIAPIQPAQDCSAILPGFDFADAYRIPNTAGFNAISAAQALFTAGPRWIKVLMDLRNRLGRLIGLKEAPPGGFPVIEESAERVVLGFDDWHLDFRIRIEVSAPAVTITTLVRTRNIVGRLYLVAVLPFHRRIVQRVLSDMSQRISLA